MGDLQWKLNFGGNCSSFSTSSGELMNEKRLSKAFVKAEVMTVDQSQLWMRGRTPAGSLGTPGSSSSGTSSSPHPPPPPRPSR